MNNILKSNLSKRIITAVTLLFIFFILLIQDYSHKALQIFFSIFIFFSSLEWFNLLFPEKKKISFLYAITIIILDQLIFFDVFFTNFKIIVLWTAVFFWLFFVPYCLYQSLSFQLDRWSWFLAIFGIFIFLSCKISLIILHEKGTCFLLTALNIVWIADTGAYFFGRKMGSLKLAKMLSPEKSIEGAIGGWLTVLIVVFLLMNCLQTLDIENFYTFLMNKTRRINIIILLSLFVILSIEGDLFESQIKRLRKIKDSGVLLPGHGGILDRIDSLLSFLPVVALFIFYCE